MAVRGLITVNSSKVAELLRNRYGLCWGWPGELEISEPEES